MMLALVHPRIPLPVVAASSFPLEHHGTKFVVFRLDKGEEQSLRFFWKRPDGSAYAGLSALRRDLAAQGEQLVFATNGGIFSREMVPMGLYIENGVILSPLNSSTGSGNFFFKPTGVFTIANNGAQVVETEAYRPADPVRLAVQSGPMLVIGGELHPHLFPGNKSRKSRNGVGVDREGRVVFAFSDGCINLHGFGTLFRDRLDCPNALALDGQLSRIYLPERNYYAFWPWRPLGTIIGLSKRSIT